MFSTWLVPRDYKREDTLSLVSWKSVCEEKTGKLVWDDRQSGNQSVEATSSVVGYVPDGTDVSGGQCYQETTSEDRRLYMRCSYSNLLSV
jgi:hypothetical protein